MSFKPPSASAITITELMIPAYTNFGGKVHGGTILSLIDKVAFAVACKHSENYCVTLSLDTVLFLKSIEVGELVHLKGSVNYVGRTSMIVGVKVMAENIKTGEVRHTNSSYLTMVALNAEGHPTPVPGISLHNRKELDRWISAYMKRGDRKDSSKETLNLSSRLKEVMEEQNVLRMF